MADIPYGRDYPDPIWCDEDGQPMPPVGAELLDDIRAFLRRFVVYPSDHELIAHTLWIAHCWFMEAWDSTPRIAFLSPEPGSGKSRALEVTEPLVPRPVHAINCTPAYLFRRVADPVGRPTVLYDECDTLFGPKAKEHEEIRGVINAGHRKGAVAGRCVIRGKIVETEELPAYCAVALAGLDDLPDTIMSRSIVVRMRRRAPTEPVEPWRPRVNGPEAEKLHDRLANWAAAINPLESGWPAMPDGVTDRRADVWESLVAVADTAGGHWPKTARATAETDATANRGAKPSIGVLLLRDIRRVFSDRDRMRTSDILTGLNRMEEGPWGSIRRGDPLDARGLATRLGRYGIGPKFQHSGGEPPYKGYSRTQFEDAWSRYLSADDETPEERDLSVSAVSAVSPPVGDPGDATGATDATDLPEAGDLPYEPPAPNGHPNGDAPLCSGPGCPNKLLSTEAKAAGKCRPCRGRAFCSPRRPPRRRPSTGVIRREPAERTRLSDTRNTVDHIIFQGERSPSLTHKRTKRQPAIAAGLNAPRRNRVGRQHGWPADVPSAEQRRAQRQRDLEAIRRAYAEMVATSHEIDDDTAELALLSMHLDDEQRRLEAGMKLGWHPYHFPDEPDSKQ
ncbi:phiRv2 prophage protein [Mycobacterium tuberculosis]|nr:phiRv2 prophage protein [Mycobacterium tuberculosis]